MTARLGRRTAAGGKIENAKHANRAAQWERDDLTRADFLARLADAAAIDAHMARFDQALGERTAFDEADAVQVAIDAQG